MLRVARAVVGCAALALAATALTVWLMVRASLPALDGHAVLPGLQAGVTIERDAAGVPTITAHGRADLARGLGYLHGQDRFFQMDLLRRAAAGELSALLGASLLEADRQLRVHRFRTVARNVVADMDPERRALLDAYVAGVNAGLASLHGRPFEYWVLQSRPQPWSAEDSILCLHAMYLQLQDGAGHGQLQRGLLRSALPEALWRFLEAGAPEWDAAVDGSRGAEPRVPLAAEVDLRARHDLPVLPPEPLTQELALLGSNNWAVSGARAGGGAAIIANDMHLGFRVPNIWYRARLIERGSGGGEGLDMTGVTLPGAPTLVAGSNGSIAWGFTDSYGDFTIAIRLVPVPNEPDAYLTAQGPRPLRYVEEAIEVKGGPTERLRVALTPWGPVIGKDWEGRPYALDWTAEDPNASNLNLLDLEHAHTATEAVRAAANIGIPAENFIVADVSGHIAWTVAGRLPIHQVGALPSLPQLSTDDRVGFAGWLGADRQPRVIDPPAGLLWSANARVVGGPAAELIGDDGMDRGARAQQIFADLTSSSRPFTPLASLRVQLDDRSLFLERWRSLLAMLIDRDRAAGRHSHDEAHDVLRSWSGHAAPGDAAYRLVRLFRAQVEARAFFMLVGPARQRAPQFQFEIPSSFEGPLWRLLEQRPLHLLGARYADWDAFLLQALVASEQLPAACRTLAACGWGRVNAVRIAHPLSRALPLLSRWLDMPTLMLPGGREDMPRVQGTDYGASERFSVAPGHEQEGYFHMPGGQSGHPFSPFFRAGFGAWADARPTPFLPGPTAHSLMLAP